MKNTVNLILGVILMSYGEYFNNEENPNKVARSTIAVYALANSDLLIEVEAVAAK